MGRCLEFGAVITPGCGHPMRAGSDSCSCAECRAVCEGQFEGCAGVWGKGSRSVMLLETEAVRSTRGHANGRLNGAANGTDARDRVSRSTPDAPPVSEQLERDLPSNSDSVPGRRREVLQWFETAFEGLHNEMRAAATEERARTVEAINAIEERRSRPDLPTAESLLDAAREAAKGAVRDALEGIERTVAFAVAERISAIEQVHAVAVEDLRFELQDIRTAHGRAIADLQGSVNQVLTAAAASDDEHRRTAPQLRSLSRALTRQLQPISDAVGQTGAEMAAVVARLNGLTEAMAETATTADLTVALDRLDGLAEAVAETATTADLTVALDQMDGLAGAIAERPTTADLAVVVDRLDAIAEAIAESAKALTANGSRASTGLPRRPPTALVEAWSERTTARPTSPAGEVREKTERGRKLSLRNVNAFGLPVVSGE